MISQRFVTLYSPFSPNLSGALLEGLEYGNYSVARRTLRQRALYNPRMGSETQRQHCGQPPLVVRGLPEVYVEHLLRCVARALEDSPHVEFGLVWLREIAKVRAKWMRDRRGQLASVLRGVNRVLVDLNTNVTRL